MEKIINKNDLKQANNAKRCEMILAIIKRTSKIPTRDKNTLEEEKGMNTIKKQTRKESFKKIQLTRKCKKCGGCNRLELENFRGVYRCENYIEIERRNQRKEERNVK